MPAAAVIPASVAYIKVAAVKRLAVECQRSCATVGGRWSLGCSVPLLVPLRVPVRYMPPRPARVPKISKVRRASSGFSNELFRSLPHRLAVTP